MKISLATDGGAEVFSDGVRVDDRKIRVVVVAECIDTVRRQQIQVDGLDGSRGGSGKTESTNSGVERGHCWRRREVVDEEDVGVLSSVCARGGDVDGNKHDLMW